jgi:hypothetical protein
MTLTRAASFVGRMVQGMVGIGGIRFWAPDDLVRRFEQHGFRTLGRWCYGIVLFTWSIKRKASSVGREA